MKISSGTAALAGVLVLICGLVAWEWYAHLRGSRPNVRPVQQIAAATPLPTSSPSPAPVTYVPQVRRSSAPVQTHTPSTAAPLPAPSPSAAPQATPAPGVTLTPYEAGSGAVAEEPMVAATLQPKAVNVEPVREPYDAPPRILSLSISTPVAHGGELVSGTVETTSNVASVEARIAGYSSAMQKIGVGRFALSYRVPNLPFFLHRTYTIEVIARNTRGDAVHSSVPITIR